MQLQAYLDLTDTTPAAFARRLGVHHSTLYRYLTNGPKGRTPRPGMARKICAITDGAVGFVDLYGEPKRKTRKRGKRR